MSPRRLWAILGASLRLSGAYLVYACFEQAFLLPFSLACAGVFSAPVRVIEYGYYSGKFLAFARERVHTV